MLDATKRVGAQRRRCAGLTCPRKHHCTGAIVLAVLLASAPAIATPQPDDLDADDPRVAPLLPILQQCVERRVLYPSAKAFFRTDYGAACAAVMLTFGLTSEAELANSWQPW